MAQTPTATPAPFNIQLSTSRGCLENGDNTVFAVGETLTVSYRINSSAVSSAVATLFDILPNGQVIAIGFGQVPTNQTRAFVAQVGFPTGVEQLVLRASMTGAVTTQRSCSFVVVNTTPGGGPTRTPTATRTITSTRTETPTPGPITPGPLSPEIHTNRGCIETGDDPVFAVGEGIQVTFRVNSTSFAAAQASIWDILPNGFTNVFNFGTIATNTTRTFSGTIAPPTGIETLQLRTRTTFSSTVTANCSFRVVSAVPTSPTQTRTPSTTRTPSATRTATATASATRTRTPSPAPTGMQACVGDCTQAGSVSIADLVIIIDIAAGNTPLSACPSADANVSGTVTLDEVLLAVNSAINGCI